MGQVKWREEISNPSTVLRMKRIRELERKKEKGKNDEALRAVT